MPDIVVLGKPIGNGFPLSAVVTTKAIAETFDNGMEYFSTFGGNPVSSAVGLAVMEVVEEEGLQRNALDVGGYLKERLTELGERYAIVGDVRGLGLFLGVELIRDFRHPGAGGRGGHLCRQSPPTTWCISGNGRTAPQRHQDPAASSVYARGCGRCLSTGSTKSCRTVC